MRTRLLAVASLALMAAISASCEQVSDDGAFRRATVFNVQARDNRFEPVAISIPPDTQVRIQLVNHDDVDHDLVIDAIDIDLLSSDLPEGVDRGEGLRIFTQVDETQSVVLSAKEPGDYSFYCSIAGHREAGMTGTLTVEAPERP